MRSVSSRESFLGTRHEFPADGGRPVSTSEGTHAKYHYLICGVQGDFTRSLVNDPPTHLWTRQLKVGER